MPEDFDERMARDYEEQRARYLEEIVEIEERYREERETLRRAYIDEEERKEALARSYRLEEKACINARDRLEDGFVSHYKMELWVENNREMLEREGFSDDPHSLPPVDCEYTPSSERVELLREVTPEDFGSVPEPDACSDSDEDSDGDADWDSGWTMEGRDTGGSSEGSTGPSEGFGGGYDYGGPGDGYDVTP